MFPRSRDSSPGLSNLSTQAKVSVERPSSSTKAGRRVCRALGEALRVSFC